MQKPVAERGFSLIEIILTIVIISIAFVAVTFSWSGIARHSSDVMWQTRIAYLGQAYLEEISSRRYDELTPVGGVPICNPCTASGLFGADGAETRQDYDDVDDYHGLSEPAIGLFNELVTSGGINAYNGYQVDVSISYVGDTYFSGSDAELVKQIQVVVTPPGNTGQAPVTFTALRGNY